LGPDDIVPCVTPRDEHYCIKSGCISKNWAVSRQTEDKYTSLVSEGRFEEALAFYKTSGKIFRSHMDIKSIRLKMRRLGLTPEQFFYFTIDRNPFTFMLSSLLYSNAAYNNASQPRRIGNKNSLLFSNFWTILTRFS